jgi:hypothetical protein
MGISFVLCGLSATNRCELTQGSSVLLCKLSLADAVGRERFFTEIAEIYASGSTLSAQEWTEFYAWHDQYMV